MRKLLALAGCLLLVAAAGCKPEDSEKSEQSNTPGGANMAVAPSPTSTINLLAIEGVCKPNKLDQGDNAAGTVKLEVPKKGEFQACGVLPPNNQGFVAFQARLLPGAPGRPTLRVVAPLKPGNYECMIAQATGVNYSPDTSIADDQQLIYVTKGGDNSSCKMETIAYDGHHWKGKLTANLLQAKPAKSDKAFPVKAEWDLYF